MRGWMSAWKNESLWPLTLRERLSIAAVVFAGSLDTELFVLLLWRSLSLTRNCSERCDTCVIVICFGNSAVSGSKRRRRADRSDIDIKKIVKDLLTPAVSTTSGVGSASTGRKRSVGDESSPEVSSSNISPEPNPVVTTTGISPCPVWHPRTLAKLILSSGIWISMNPPMPTPSPVHQVT
ncbi:hypothetical protein CEXT_445941 [Caerostris extrusa]|uniref:Uncharacterized protein n=1 Tax=Caerostris extrusa TaxID=172846 RepID=A0AAV4USE7_CAEEX|nr:hypothetical protein CEXT_445941 [Caerostris extrusa]